MAPPPPESASALPEPGGGWRPYVIAFLIGAVLLTVLPLLQRQFLKAPAPVKQLDAWSLSSLSGGDVTSSALAGQVVLLSAELGACDASCVQRQADFGTAIRHVDDLKKTPITLVTVVGPQAHEALTAQIAAGSPAWRFAKADDAFIAQLQGGLDAFLPPPGAVFSGTQSIVLIDQNDAIRGFWMADGVGRGNSINAARLLSKEGPNP